MTVNQYRKAIVAGVVAFLTALAASVEDGLTAAELLTALAGLAVALGGVWAVPNAAPPPVGAPGNARTRRRRAARLGGEDGAVSATEVLAVALIVLLILVCLRLLGAI